jgi:multidrug efflux pump subunit AcrA (membrane-fusion protein)
MALLLLAVVVVIGGAAGAAYGLTRPSGPDYRLATVGRGDVTQTVSSNGTVTTASQVEVGFSVSGTVSAVPVSVGQKVAKGDTLATLDTTSLERAVAQDTLTLAQAELQLALAENPPATSTTGSGSTGTGQGGQGADRTGGSSSGALAEGSGSGRGSGSDRSGSGDGQGSPSQSGEGNGRPGESSSGSAGQGSGSGSSSTGAGSGSGVDSAQLAALVTKVQDAEKALELAQQSASTALTDIEGKIAAEQQVCAAQLSGQSAPSSAEPPSSAPTSTPTSDSPTAAPTTASSEATDTATDALTSSSPATDATPTDTTPTDGATSAPPTSTGVVVDGDCLAAINAVLAAQNDNSAVLGQIHAAANALSAAIADLQTALPESSTNGSGSHSGDSDKGGTGGRSSSSPTSSTTGHDSSYSGSVLTITPAVATVGGPHIVTVADGAGSGAGSGQIGTSAADISADKAAVSAAKANLQVVQAQLAAATLKSPISGTVAVVGLTAGDSASSSKTITIIGAGGHNISTTVTLANVDLVKVGQPASVVVDGVSAPIPGTVDSIGVVNSGSGSSVAYPVVITLENGGAELFDGTGAQVTITVGTARDVVIVPMSAVKSVGSNDVVTVIEAGKPALKRITVGVVGASSIEVKSGLSVGDRVVLADLSQGLPSSTTTTSRNGFSRTGGAGGGFAGGGFVGGGFGGAGLGSSGGGFGGR